MKRIILVARYYSIEPLGILYLAGLARRAGWDCKVVLAREFDFGPVYEAVKQWRPDIVGFQIWTGYHLQAFVACDQIRAVGVPVVIGGPHATYFDKECSRHADFVVKASGFGLLERILEGTLSSGVHFEEEGRKEPFPLPDRAVVYDAYPELGASPIKSIFGSVGCPMKCTYCYAPVFNQMHGGFDLTVRPVDDLVAEAHDILRHWPLDLVYFQDDIFGYNFRWLEEFSVKWKEQVSVPFHAQIRLELTRGDKGNRTLDHMAKAGCTGITLAIESGNAFLRDHVLFRSMPDALIIEGCRKIMDRGMTLRTEQILAVPFSDRETDLATLGLNNAINPTMAWTSILAPYGGTAMGTISSKFGLYNGTNDDLSETFFDRSVLRHIEGGPRDIERIVNSVPLSLRKEILLKLNTRVTDHLVDVRDSSGTIDTVRLLEDKGNDRYCTDTVRLQRLFNWLAKVPEAETLGRHLVSIPDAQWNWESIGSVTRAHLEHTSGDRLEGWKRELASQMDLPVEALPEPIAQNPYYFTFLPEGGGLAHKALSQGCFTRSTTAETLDELGTITRRHLFHYGLYKIAVGKQPIAA